MNDQTVHQHVLNELEYAPMIDATQIGVVVENSVVTLTGHVRNYAEKGSRSALRSGFAACGPRWGRSRSVTRRTPRR